ncbi:EKC/KEOPS complex subunit LAGE3 [Cricetulus griseus]|uniref:L antigen family member 3 n=1 Tax=Cricetulus griseus TaxID=10029 RepID=A0A3L7H149_CRIGR|nr:EKC/KEOPS complex subunit LAGE3 [Cricetulus griseus]XP_003513941.1 EKC/KEOPS complex subunit LAGE3 [Cricetulus griseus]XP_003515981.1 EKC/KEOPS complex subunit LAGE3 [Cricetulus griseus]XP_027287786.1 EKC/KEOPS complex subunit LAGE3-like [Cricetulus griseus]XP_027289478.1 EKC/KEOPS complex subunit LAGE3 [Cricetulus griseus]XP_035305764.1 EKC/KEOPS complex subunit LAGE3 [Cricetulus griseus]
MQDPDEGLDGRAVAEGGDENGQQSPQAPEAQASSESSATEGDRGNFPQSGPQDASSPAAPCSPAAPGSHSAPGSPSPGSPVGSGAAAEEAAVVPHSEQPPLVPGPSGDTASTTGNRLLEFSVTVPFRSAVEADMARRSLVSNARRQQVIVLQEFTVNDSTLSVRWTTEDPVLFRISINTFLDQLSLVMRNIQRLEFVAVVKRGRGRSRES